MEANQREVAESRYLWHERKEKTWEEASLRISRAVFEREKDPNGYIEAMTESLHNLEFLFGGRTLRNAGRSKGNLINCIGLTLEDDTDKIGMFIHDALMCWKKGAGIGFVVDLRPTDAPLITDGGESSGAVSWLTAINGCGDVIKTGGQRRAAGLAMMHISHPEILHFMDAKLKEGQLSCFNISVIITNDFLESVERDSEWKFSYAGKEYGSMSARELWNRILENMVQSAEPGIINWDNFTKNNSYFCAPVVTANACCEQALERFGACCLGAINLTKFITEGGQLKRQKLEETTRLAVRALDNVLDVSWYPLKQIEQAAQAIRRIGIGTMGLADVFFMKEIRYGSEESLEFADKIYTLIQNTAYDESVRIASEKGSFPKFDPSSFGRASFVRKLPQGLRASIKRHGIRNVALTSGQPTGTTSLVAGTSSGIEPHPSLFYRRADNVSSRVYIHPAVLESLQGSKRLPGWLCDAHSISPEDHLNMLVRILRRTDSNISKTVNLKEGTTAKQLGDILLEYMWDLKSITVYVDGSRKKQVIYPLTKKEAVEYLKQHEPEKWKAAMDECKGGVCEL